MIKGYHIVFKHEALLDISESYDYYVVESKGLTNRFLDCLEDVYNYLISDPRIFRRVEKGFYQVPVKIFPFVILYKIYGNEVVIFRVFHTSRNPVDRV
ncbi:type II toxin-antitoxin system RelE/ParE family toxin [Sinomicrobium weinanense]|uniref:Type II toxin-antitoxin system RelE/ParE family toxin n=1 Tax=Sinomicrobium weinanense TaxID=2842200 RepID=A0A926Q4X9_9FLAO|nr:type II toxin-antitoxin system RelE/ParE family toxin [Sinomicrobium weinanense]MBU3123890.1 type II toxin-antitoxin system RelE/ParE family toxin [Sinomicrobium weinanense]